MTKHSLPFVVHGVRNPCRWAILHFGMLTALASCGAKTGLLTREQLPDAHTDPTDAFVRFDACVAGRFELRRRSAEVLFVIDRSASMAAPLERNTDGESTVSRWDVLRQVLQSTLPSVQDAIEMGAVFYPRTPVVSTPSPQELCMVDSRPNVPIEPANANDIVLQMRLTTPRGATPTYRALTVAGDLLRARNDRWRARYIVLATDGGPNCNERLDPTTCNCIELDASVCRSQPGLGRWFCLDDERTVIQIETLAREGIFTYVIGIDDPTTPNLTRVLDRMAEAGRRANPRGPERYYSVRRREDLQMALQTISHTIARCAYVTPSRPDDPDAIQVEINGHNIPRDLAHHHGWDWTDPDFGEITLYGAPCDQARTPGSTVIATVACRNR